jgi:hypothetical protein
VSELSAALIEMKARLSHLSPLDFFAIAVAIVGILSAIYLSTLRHP